MSFPKGFLWGASTSAYQCEGAYCEDGKGMSVQDMKTAIPQGTSDYKVTSDFYHHYQEDIALMAEMGLKAFRFSIAWSRILPEGIGEVNQKGIDFYHAVIDTCISYQIEPIITMYHFDLPWALEKLGGWSNRTTVDAFTAFAEIIFKEYGHKVTYFLTINEQNMMILHGSVLGTSDASKKDEWKELYLQNHHMMLAQAQAMILCHKTLPHAQIAPAPNISSIYPKTCNPKDVLAAQNFSSLRNWLYLDLAVHGTYPVLASSYLEKNGYMPDISEEDRMILRQAKPDFIAMNYYNTLTVKHSEVDSKETASYGDQQIAIAQEGYFMGCENEYLPSTAFGWDIDPIGFRATLREVYDRYHLPIMITENGIGAFDQLENEQVHDQYRIEYYEEHLKHMKDAIEEGVDVIGYCPWSAIDLISTHQGMAKRYGFIYIDREEFDLKDLKRYKKDSFYWYQNLIKENGNTLNHR